MLTLIYDPNETAIPDGHCDELAERMAKSYELDQTYIFGAANIFYAVRVLVGRGKIPANKVIFKYKDQEIHIDSNGRCTTWPRGFCEYEEVKLELLIESIIQTN